MSYGRKQKKHTRAIYLNTEDAYYVNGDRTLFSFRIPPINIEDESLLYVRNTNTDYKTSGLSVGKINQGFFSASSYLSTYNSPPSLIFTPQDGKGTGATGIAILAPSGLSGSASSTTTSVNSVNAGSGYTGVAASYVATANTPSTGGTGATITSGTLTTNTGSFAPTGTLVAGSGYTDVPTFNVPAPPASVPAIFAAVAYTASTGVITAAPAVSNPTLNGFYNTSTFAAVFTNNPIVAQGFCSTNATGGLTSIIISNAADNGYYSSGSPITILSINGVLLGTGGTGLVITPTYSNGRAVSIVVNTAGSGYGNNLVDAPVVFSAPAAPVAATIASYVISQGRLTSITMGTGGSGYYNPTITITAGLVIPVQATYAPVFKIASVVNGFRLLTYGRGYTKPPIITIDSTNRVASNGDVPATAEMTPSYLVEPNSYYTIKADGFTFNRTLYTNSDNKGTPTLAVCSTNENVNNEDYVELVLPAQVINDFSLTIKDKDGLGVDVNKNMTLLLSIEELDDSQSQFKESRRQKYPLFSVS